jgi:histone H3
MKSEAVSPDSLGELEVLGHDGHSLGVDGAQVGILEEGDQIGFRSFLQGEHSLALESHFLLELSRDFSHQSLEGQLPDKQIGLPPNICTLFWNFLISRSATVPGLKRWGFLRPEGMGALFLAIFWATSCLRGTF